MLNDNENVCLRHNALAEPLFNQWYAWPYLIAPQTAAMYVANWHLKIMQSFVAAPQTHAAALKNPAMIGGPFMNYDASRVAEVKALLNKTIDEQADLLELAEGIKALNLMLSGEAVGYSMEPLYPRTPDCLRGLIELVYDLNNNPSARFIEGLLYRSKFYKPSSQSVALSLIKRDDRPFILSTPRLDEEGSVRLKLPFRDEAYDLLFKTKAEPRPFGEIKEAAGVAGDQAATFAGFFTPHSYRKYEPFRGDGVRVRYFGHACVVIESKDVSILIDPLISYECDSEVPRFSFADAPDRLDYVLITHNHQDHCLIESLIQLRHKIKNIIVPKSAGGTLADPSLKAILQNIGFRNVTEIDELQEIEIDGGSVTGVPFLGEHADLDIRTKTAHLVKLNGKKIMCAADSNNIEPRLYERIQDIVGNVDALFLGMECVGGPLTWLYGPLLTKPLARKMDQTRRFTGSDYARASEMVKRLSPKHVYVYAMGHEPWLTFLLSINYTSESPQITESNKLVEECRSRGINSERLFGRKTILL
jgi:L-ascorbate metabolism protein UlaG (beta-lactamase superfamily)